MASVLLTPFAVNGSCIITLHSVFVHSIWSNGHSPSVWILWLQTRGDRHYHLIMLLIIKWWKGEKHWNIKIMTLYMVVWYTGIHGNKYSMRLLEFCLDSNIAV